MLAVIVGGVVAVIAIFKPTLHLIQSHQAVRGCRAQQIFDGHGHEALPTVAVGFKRFNEQLERRFLRQLVTLDQSLAKDLLIDTPRLSFFVQTKRRIQGLHTTPQMINVEVAHG